MVQICGGLYIYILILFTSFCACSCQQNNVFFLYAYCTYIHKVIEILIILTEESLDNPSSHVLRFPETWKPAKTTENPET